MRRLQNSAAAKWLPILEWAPDYRGATFLNDLVAAAIVTIMLIPQSMAYAMLAGLPPITGLYASILPLVVYAVFGTSRTMAVGPVAIVSLMTASAASAVASPGSEEYATAALVLALGSGVILLAMGALRLGFLANFLSHPVMAGFVTASAVLIAASQLKHILGIEASGRTALELFPSLASGLGGTNLPTLVLGTATIGFLFWSRRSLAPALVRIGMSRRPAGIAAKAGPIAAVAATSLLAWGLDLPEQGVAVVGEVPTGLPPLTVPGFDAEMWSRLAWSAGLIALIGFVESVAVAQALAARRRQRIRPDQELVGLGAANLAAGFTGGMPVTGGFARSVVNFDAGAETPAAGALAAGGIAVAIAFLTPLLAYLPQATLAATVIVAILQLVDLAILRRSWTYSKPDFAAVALTMALTLLAGVEAGVGTGVAVSIVLYLYRSSRPHVAEVGLVPGTEHFRNVLRHEVVTAPDLLTVRVDESLYFANARRLEEQLADMAASRPELKNLVVMCTAVNEIDLSALESLEALNARLKDMGVTLHLSEVKGPVMDRLKRSSFLRELTGEVFLSQYQAFATLAPDAAERGAAATNHPNAMKGGSA